MSEPRIVSLLASTTEIVCALGFRANLVGRSHECDFPADVEMLPPCTEPKFNTYGTSYEIDERVRAIVQEGLAVYRVDSDRLKELSPDVIVTQDQCEVCAASVKDVEAAVCEWTGHNARIVSTRAQDLAGVWQDIVMVAEALGVKAKGAAYVRGLQVRVAEIAAKAKTLPEKPRVAVIEWIEPIMAGGNWMPELVTLAGGESLFAEAGKNSPYIKWDELRAADPDVILITPCGFGIPRALEDMPRLLALPGWFDLKAVREGRVVVADGNHYFNRPGPRLVESLEILTEILHPAQFRFGHEGTGWIRFKGAPAA